jgi:hypothetical protein
MLVLAAALLGALGWFGAPPLTAAVIEASLRGSGWRAAETSVTVTSQPPPRLLLGRADRITIAGSDVSWRELHAARIALTLNGVDLLARTATTVRGSITDATLSGGLGASGDGDPVAPASIELAGPAAAAQAMVTIDRATVRRVVRDAIARQFGTTVEDVRLVAPDRLRLVTARAMVEGSLRIDGGDLVFSTPLGSVTMLRTDPSIPLRLRSVAVTDAALMLDGVVDVASLLHG